MRTTTHNLRFAESFETSKNFVNLGKNNEKKRGKIQFRKPEAGFHPWLT